MKYPKVSPSTGTDELRGMISGNIPQMLDSLDHARNHYEIFKDLGITPENAGTPSAQQKMLIMHKLLRFELHPDKVFNKLHGGETEDQIAALRDKMEERYKKLQEAFAVLSDKEKRATYNNTLQKRVFSTFEAPDLNYPSSPNQNSTIFQATVPLEDIEDEFTEFVIQNIGDDASFETNGYSMERGTDPETGRKMLRLSFPNEDTAHQFIKRLQDKNMIQSPWEALKESANRAPEAPEDDADDGEKSPSPFRLPELKPQLVPPS